MHAKAIQHLTESDDLLAPWIRRIGPCRLSPDPRRSVFQALVRSVAHQQLNGRAADTILARFSALFPHGRWPEAREVLALGAEPIRAAGFSSGKTSCILELARRVEAGELPDRKEMELLTDDAVVERLTVVKGIGRWSVEMFLMFGLGRPDVLPVQDFGIQSGFRIVYRKRGRPSPDRIRRHGERWRPYRTTASWYLWRAVDLESGGVNTW